MMDNWKHRMIDMNRLGLALAVVLVTCSMMGGLPLSASAQNQPNQAVRTLVIKDNRVLIDGRAIDRQELPETLRLDSLSVSYSFIGIDQPVVNLKNHFFAVRPDRLELIPGQYDFHKIRMTGKDLLQQKLDDPQGWIVDSDRGEYYSFQGERLEANEAVPKLLNEANNLYLSGLQDRNQSLYSRLSKEGMLESEAAQLAIRVRAAQSEAERSANVEQLTAKLNEIFEFKQANRRAEIAQFERELARLRDRLERREAQKQRLINRRLELLLKGTPEDQP